MTANFCADCGGPLVAGKRFCPSCGAETPVGQQGAPAGPPAGGPVGSPGGNPPPGPPGVPVQPATVLPNLIGAVVGLAIVATVGTYVLKDDPEAAKFLDMVSQKIESIVTPKPPIGNLTVIRDLKGTWKSSLKGKGFQLYGSFNDGTGNVTVYEDGDMELVIDSVSGNTAKGRMRMTNLYVSSRASIPGRGSVSTPRTLVTRDSGYSPIVIRVSGTHLDFGSFAVDGASGSMQGSYTTDLISGTMTVKTRYGPIKGEFHLIRQK